MNTVSKPKHTFDLSAFDNASNGAFGTTNLNTIPKPDNQINAVLAIKLSLIIEDEHQPRTDFNDDDWRHFVADIKKHGVRNPIHIRTATEATGGIHKIINGARRYRASVDAGLDTIPCLIQVDEVRFDDYAQLLDNIKNQAMTAMDIALFIKKRMVAGDSKSAIAEKLSVNNNYITHHLALTEMSEVVQSAYDNGKIKGAQLIYRLNKLYGASPALAETIINNNDEITNALIIQVRKSLEAPAQYQICVEDLPEGYASQSAVDHVSNSADYDSNNAVNQDVSDDPSESSVTVKALPYHNPDNEESSNTKLADPSKIKKPLLLARYQGHQACVVLLHEKPTEAGLIWIKLEDTAEKLEVVAETITLGMLTEAQGKE